MTGTIDQSNLGLVKSIAGYYARFGAPFDDLVQEGLIGILEAMKRFDPERGTKFSTYASFWIKKRILMFLETERNFQSRTVDFNDNIEYDLQPEETQASKPEPVAVDLPGGMPKIEQVVIRGMYEENRTLAEISETLGLRREKVRQIRQKALRRLRNHYEASALQPSGFTI